MFDTRLRDKLLLFLAASFTAAFPLFANPIFAPVFTVPKVWFLWVVASLILLSLSLSRHGKSEIKVLIPSLLYFVTALFSVMFASSRVTAIFGEYARWDGLITIGLCMVLFALPIIALNENRIVTSMKGLLFSSIIGSSIAIYERIFSNPFLVFTKTYDPAGHGALNSMDISRSVSAFGSPLYLAAFLVLAIPVSIYFSSSRESAESMAGKLAFALSTAALALTYSRGAWLGAIASFVLILLLQRKNIKTLLKTLALPAMFSVTILMLLLIVVSPGQHSVAGRAVSIFKAESGARPGIWAATLKMIEAKPLLGYGPDNFKSNFVRFKPRSWNTNNRQPVPDKAHNEFLQQAATVGLLGSMTFVWLVLFILMKIYYSRNSLLTTTLGAAVVAYSVQATFNFFQVSTAPLFWLLAGMAVALTINGRKFELPTTNKAFYFNTGLRTFIAVPLIILANFLWIADYSFQSSLEAAQNDSSSALTKLKSATTFFPFEERYFNNYGKALAGEFKKNDTRYLFAHAERALGRAVALNPNSIEAMLAKGDLYAAALLPELDRKVQDEPFIKEVAKKAVNTYEEIFAIDKHVVEAYLGRGIIKACGKDFKGAIADWNGALKVDSASANALFNIGWAYERLNNKTSALDAYGRALELAPDMAEARAAKLRLTGKNNERSTF